MRSSLPLSHLVFLAMRRLARSVYSLTKLLLGWIFAHMSFALPVKRLRETDTLIAFYHPRPSYPLHILLSPKKAVASLAELDPHESQAFLVDLFQAVRELVVELGLEPAGYRLVVNGGAHQDIPQLHFHLISGAFPEIPKERSTE